MSSMKTFFPKFFFLKFHPFFKLFIEFVTSPALEDEVLVFTFFTNLMDCSPSSFPIHGFPRQEYWSGLPFPSSEDLPDPGHQESSL